ncbi:phosphotransferase enzyme family protein [Streptomyces sp. NPDC020379]|uniref:phosphotransferase enzyme family protein n=1 Tax=Streptomyces sp. NPDC020379 TaxID=3365071 RepID=UPI0037B120DF
MTDPSVPQGPVHQETELTGGGTTRVVRAGETVRRPVRPWTPAVHLLLDHLARRGFPGAPRQYGVDEQDREVLDYLPGEVGNYPLSPAVRGETALVTAARLLRSFHDSTAELAARPTAGWQFPAMEPAEVICHGDFAPYNCVFGDGRAVGVIDFDTARPGPRHWDLSYALYRFAPLTDPSNGDGFGDAPQQARRARLFLDAYGCTAPERAEVVESVPDRLRWLVTFMHEAADRGNTDFARHIEEGHADLYLRDIDHVERHRDLWQHRVVD